MRQPVSGGRNEGASGAVPSSSRSAGFSKALWDPVKAACAHTAAMSDRKSGLYQSAVHGVLVPPMFCRTPHGAACAYTATMSDCKGDLHQSQLGCNQAFSVTFSTARQCASNIDKAEVDGAQKRQLGLDSGWTVDEWKAMEIGG